MTNVVALVPARAGSKKVPGKNVRSIGGHPLLEWTIAASQKAKEVQRIIVSTDSPEYAALARELGAEAPFLRPAEISGDRAADYEFVIHALDWLASRGEEPELVVHMRPTTPLRDPRLVDEAVRCFMNSSDATALRSVQEMSESAYKTFEIGSGGQLKRVGTDITELDAANDARQCFPKTYSPNGYVDVLCSAFIREAELIHGDHVIPFVTPSVVEVDTEEDIALIEAQLSLMPEVMRHLFE